MTERFLDNAWDGTFNQQKLSPNDPNLLVSVFPTMTIYQRASLIGTGIYEILDRDNPEGDFRG